MNRNIFSERLSILMKQKSLNQKTLALKAGVTEAAISHYLKGDRTPRAVVAANIADALDTSIDYLTGSECDNSLDGFNHAKRLVARNVHQMSQEQKLEIIKILMSEN